MKTKGYFFLAGATFLLLALSSCNYPPSTGTPICPTSGLQAPVLTGPTMWSVVSSLSPSLSWSYPDATCNPQGYAIDLRTGPLFTDSLGGGTGNPSTSWGPGSSLQPGREYEWGVQAINGSTPGPFAGYNYFFTGPMCATAALTAPTLLQPANGAVLTNLDPSLIWQYLDACLPQGYRVDLSTDATFADTNLSGGTGNPSTRWGPAAPLADCAVYFWKVTPINDTTQGPASGVFSFTTNALGTCPSPTPPGTTTTLVGPTSTLENPTDVPTLAAFIFVPNINVNCRSGPDPVFDIVDVGLKGGSYLMDGRNQADTWYRIMLLINEGCWVTADSGTPSRDTADLRVLFEPPTPTPIVVSTTIPTTVACYSFTNEKSCISQPACKWKIAATGAGSCVNK